MASTSNSNSSNNANSKASEPVHKVSLVTGGNRGIGSAIVRGLAKGDAEGTVIFSVRDEKKGQAALDKFRAEGLKNVSFVVFDVTDSKAVSAAVESILKTHKRIDVVVNNSGVLLDAGTSALQFSSDLFNKTAATNVFGVLNVIQAVLPSMKANNFGRIVNVSSIAGSLSLYGATAAFGAMLSYRSSKAVLNLLTLALAHELKDYNIQINAHNPGPVDTDMATEAHMPKEVLLTVEQGADTAVWLATQPTSESGPRGGFFSERKPMAF